MNQAFDCSVPVPMREQTIREVNFELAFTETGNRA